MGRDWLDQVASFAGSVEVEKEPATVSERPSKAGGTKQKGVAMLVTFASVMPQRSQSYSQFSTLAALIGVVMHDIYTKRHKRLSWGLYVLVSDPFLTSTQTPQSTTTSLYYARSFHHALCTLTQSFLSLYISSWES